MKKIAGLIFLLCGCSYFGHTDKTPLTPQGQLNVCIRDEVLKYRESGVAVSRDSWSAAQRIAQICTDEYNLPAMYNQAVENARNMMSEDSRGTSLRRW